MILCLCRGISERTVKAVIGAGAHTLDDVAAECAAGSDCGACQDMLLDLLADARARRACTSEPAAVPA
jgi:bacterioferritin-associated ferredoxin